MAEPTTGADAYTLAYLHGAGQLTVIKSSIVQWRWVRSRDIYNQKQVQHPILALHRSARNALDLAGMDGALLVDAHGRPLGVMVAIDQTTPSTLYALDYRFLQATLRQREISRGEPHLDYTASTERCN